MCKTSSNRLGHLLVWKEEEVTWKGGMYRLLSGADTEDGQSGAWKGKIELSQANECGEELLKWTWENDGSVCARVSSFYCGCWPAVFWVQSYVAQYP